ncbi:MAG TPA: hypothetical protein VGB82_00745 [Alphaproteobacteria bacterium]
MTEPALAERSPAFVAHLTPGRVRLRIPERRNDDEFFVAVRQRVGGWPGIEEVRVNPLTASVLIFFGDAAAAFAHVQQCDLFEIRDAERSRRPALPIVDSARETAHSLNDWIRRLTGGALDLRSLMFIALVLAGIIEMYRGNVRAPAFSLLWYAAELLRLWPNGVGPDIPSVPVDP